MEIYVEEHVGRVFLDENEFPDDLEGRMSSVLNAVNTELKTVTLLHLDDRPADHIEIKERIRDTRGNGYLPQENVFGDYGETLQSIALVAKQTIVRDDGEIQVLGYSLTEAGKKYGVPIAEHVLKWVVDNNLSMYQILGSTVSSGKKRSPENRIGILEALSTGKASEAELTDFLSLNHVTIQKHLLSLREIGFIYWDSVGAKSKGFSKYIWVEEKNPEDVEAVEGLVTLTKKVAREMFKGQNLDCNMLSERLQCRPKKISSVLVGLKRQGFVRGIPPYQSRVVMSESGILDPGKRFLEEVLYPVKEHVSDSPVLETDFGERSSEYVAKGIDIYARVSPGKNKISSSERIQQIKSYLLKNSGVTSREISGAIGLDVSSIRTYLRKMDSLRTEKEGSEIRYFLSDGNVE